MPRPPLLGDIAHLTLPVGDLDTAQRFYVDLLGATLLRRLDRAAFLAHRPDRAHEADADNSPLHLAIRLGDGPEVHLFLQRDLVPHPPRPHPHLALSVDTDDLPRFQALLQAAGIPLDGPRRLGPPGHASLYFPDPWGNLLELVTLAYEGPVELGPPELTRLAPSRAALLSDRASRGA